MPQHHLHWLDGTHMTTGPGGLGLNIIILLFITYWPVGQLCWIQVALLIAQLEESKKKHNETNKKIHENNIELTLCSDDDIKVHQENVAKIKDFKVHQKKFS